MDLIERLFGLAPDGGSGATELAIFVAVMVVCAAFAKRRQIRDALTRRMFSAKS